MSVALDSKAPKNHAGTSIAYGLGTTVDYGHVKVRNDLSQTGHENGVALSAYQGKVLKDSVDKIIEGTTQVGDSAKLNGKLASHNSLAITFSHSGDDGAGVTDI